jgi:FkbM family methyltransferase
MNLSRIADQSFVGKLLRLPLRLIPHGAVLPILQGRLRGKKWIVGSSVHGCWLGSYEYDKRRLFEAMVREGTVVFDIGAHVGFYTLLASELVGSRGRVFAFEPLPANLVYLKEHLRLNRAGNVTIIEAAVSDRCGTSYFDEGPGRSMAHLASEAKLLVQTVTIDDLVARGQIPLPDCIKIDVEGAEARVLSGAQWTLTQSRPVIFLATHGIAVHQQCCHLLRALGYALRPIGGMDLDASNEILAVCHTRD